MALCTCGRVSTTPTGLNYWSNGLERRHPDSLCRSELGLFRRLFQAIKVIQNSSQQPEVGIHEEILVGHAGIRHRKKNKNAVEKNRECERKPRRAPEMIHHFPS